MSYFLYPISGKVFWLSSNKQTLMSFTILETGCVRSQILSFFLSLGKIFVPKQKPIDLRQEEVTTLDPELEEALSSATNTELCDIAGKSREKSQVCVVANGGSVNTNTRLLSLSHCFPRLQHHSMFAFIGLLVNIWTGVDSSSATECCVHVCSYPRGPHSGH